MSISGYFQKVRDLRMPKLPDPQDELGIRWKGPVVQGDLSVREAFARRAAGLPLERDDSRAFAPSQKLRR